jgi:hypothetical protein
MVLVSTRWLVEKRKNMNTVVRIMEELAENASVEFGGAIPGPHAFLIKKEGQITRR